MDFYTINADMFKREILQAKNHMELLLEKAEKLQDYTHKVAAAANKSDNEVINELKEENKKLRLKIIDLEQGSLTEDEIKIFNEKMKGKYEISIVHTGVGAIKHFIDLKHDCGFKISDLT